MSKKLFFFGMAVLAIALLAVTSCDRNNPLDSAQDLNISEPSGTTESLAIEDPQGREPPTTSGATTWPRSMADFKFPFQGVYNNYYTGPIWRITCGYNTYPYHVHNWYSEGAGKYSIDLIRYGSQSLGRRSGSDRSCLSPISSKGSHRLLCRVPPIRALLRHASTTMRPLHTCKPCERDACP